MSWFQSKVGLCVKELASSWAKGADSDFFGNDRVKRNMGGLSKIPYLRLCTWVGNSGYFICVQDDWTLSAKSGMFHSYENDFGQESFWKFIILENTVSQVYVFFFYFLEIKSLIYKQFTFTERL